MHAFIEGLPLNRSRKSIGFEEAGKLKEEGVGSDWGSAKSSKWSFVDSRLQWQSFRLQ